MSSKPMTEDREPRTEPLTAEEEAELRAEHAVEHWTVGLPYCAPCRLLVTLDAAREQAATEARRELLARMDARGLHDYRPKSGTGNFGPCAFVDCPETDDVHVSWRTMRAFLKETPG